MEIQLPQEQRAIVEGLVAAGRFSSVEDVISEGIRLLAYNEKLRREVQVGLEQADRGELIDHDTVFGQLKTLAKEAKANNE
jgi:antitoxin ParD1/3/4